MRGRGTDLPGGCRPRPHPSDGERHPSGLVVEVEPLLVQSAVSAEQLAVVGRADEDGVVARRRPPPGGPARAGRPPRRGAGGRGPGRPVHCVGRPGRRRPTGRSRRGRRPGTAPARRACVAQVLVLGGGLGHGRGVEGRGRQGPGPLPDGEEHDVVRVDEARHQQERAKGVGITGPAALRSGRPARPPTRRAVSGSRRRPLLAIEAPWGSGPIQPEKPKGSSTSASR